MNVASMIDAVIAARLAEREGPELRMPAILGETGASVQDDAQFAELAPKHGAANSDSLDIAQSPQNLARRAAKPPMRAR